MCPGPVDEADDIPRLSLSAPMGAAQVIASSQAEHSEAPTSEGSNVGHALDAGRDPRTERPPLDYWFGVLRDAVNTMTPRGGWAMAAGVSAQMRAIEPEFTPRIAGFSKFRSFLDAAVKAGIVTIRPSEQTGAPDTAVSAINQDDVNAARNGTDQPLADDSARLVYGLWRAVLDWHPSKRAVWDQQNRRVSLLRYDDPVPASQVEVPHFDRQVHIDWMREFAVRIVDSDQNAQVNEALTADDPVAQFNRVLRSESVLDRSWRTYIRSKITSEIDNWALKNGIEPGELREVAPHTFSRPGQLAQSDSAPAASRSTSDRLPTVPAAPTPDEIRQRVVRAVGLMPVSELLRLPIPIEYLLR